MPDVKGFYETLASFDSKAEARKNIERTNRIGDKPWSANTKPAHFIITNKYTVQSTCFVCNAVRTCSFHIHREENGRVGPPLMSFCYEHEHVGQRQRMSLQREVDAVVAYFTERTARMEDQRG